MKIADYNKAHKKPGSKAIDPWSPKKAPSIPPETTTNTTATPSILDIITPVKKKGRKMATHSHANATLLSDATSLTTSTSATSFLANHEPVAEQEVARKKKGKKQEDGEYFGGAEPPSSEVSLRDVGRPAAQLSFFLARRSLSATTPGHNPSYPHPSPVPRLLPLRHQHAPQDDARVRRHPRRVRGRERDRPRHRHGLDSERERAAEERAGESFWRDESMQRANETRREALCLRHETLCLWHVCLWHTSVHAESERDKM